MAIATVPVTFEAVPLTFPVTLPVRGPEKAGAVTVPVKVGEAIGALREVLPSSLSMAERIESVAPTIPAPDANPVRTLAVTVAAAIAVADWVPVTSPAREPEKVDAVVAEPAVVADVAVAALPVVD